MLADRDIRQKIKDGDFELNNITDKQFEKQLQPASLDIRLSNKLIEFSYRKTDVDLKQPDIGGKEVFIPKQGYVLGPQQFVLGSTVEGIELDSKHSAKLEGRSSLGRLGLVIHSTAGFIDPGFKGQITLEIYNFFQAPLILYPDLRIGQLTFHELTNKCEESYGEKDDAKYQNQSGPVSSKFEGNQS